MKRNTRVAPSRRTFLGIGTCALAATASILASGSAEAETGLSPEIEKTVRNYYKLWETKDWRPMDMLLADDFTFTSPNGDDHISKSEFKARCWETQIDHTKRFDLLHVFGSGNAAFVMYNGITNNDKTFRNVEFLQVRNGKVEFIECYFGGNATFPSAVSAGQK